MGELELNDGGLDWIILSNKKILNLPEFSHNDLYYFCILCLQNKVMIFEIIKIILNSTPTNVNLKIILYG